MGKIATEQYCASKGGGSPYTNNLCATKSRAQTLGCVVSGSYANNQLVEEGSLSKANFGKSSLPILYTNSYQSSYKITTDILSTSSGWIPYLIRVIPKNYFGTDSWELYASRWLMIAPPAYWECDDTRHIFWQNNSRVCDVLYGGYNTGDYASQGYWFPNKGKTYISWNLNNGWPRKADTSRIYHNASPRYGIAHCDDFGSANFHLEGDNGYSYCPTLAELLVIMYNFNTINDAISKLRNAGWWANNYTATLYNVYPLPYCNYLSNTYGPYGYYYTRPITGDGGIRPSYVYDYEIRTNTTPTTSYPCYAHGYNIQAKYCGNKKFNMLAIIEGDDWQLNCMSSALDRLY